MTGGLSFQRTTRLLNRYEEVTYDRLIAVTSENDALVFPKVRIADVLSINNSGISSEHFQFALKAHFDFIVTDSGYQPLFAIEFDGPLHNSEDQKRRDLLKNSVCDFFDLPLLRINANYLDVKYRDLDLLTYFVEVWFLAVAFYEAQERGSVPYDEPFDPTFICTDGRRQKKWPYWLSLGPQESIRDYHRHGRILDPSPSHWLGVDSRGNYHCLTWLQPTRDTVLASETGMRMQRFPVDLTDLLSQLAAFEIWERTKCFMSGNLRDLPAEHFTQLLTEYKARYEFRSFAGRIQYRH